MPTAGLSVAGIQLAGQLMHLADIDENAVLGDKFNVYPDDSVLLREDVPEPCAVPDRSYIEYVNDDSGSSLRFLAWKALSLMSRPANLRRAFTPEFDNVALLSKALYLVGNDHFAPFVARVLKACFTDVLKCLSTGFALLEAPALLPRDSDAAQPDGNATPPPGPSGQGGDADPVSGELAAKIAEIQAG